MTVLEDTIPRWEMEFPGDSASLQSLREIVALADADRLQTCSILDTVKSMAAAAHCPPLAWDPPIAKAFRALQHQHRVESRHFTIVLNDLKSAHATYKIEQAEIAAVIAATPAPKPPSLCIFEQIIEVKIVNGEVITEIQNDATFYCKHSVWSAALCFNRQFSFENAIIPECFQWVLMHDGELQPAYDRITITYTPEEFKRLCWLEIDTKSPVLLDGEHLRYHGGDNYYGPK